MSQNQGYLDFDEYIRQGEPSKREAAYAWSTANYKSAQKGIDYTPVYLERFFRNLLLGEKWELRNRYLHIHAPKEWSVQPNLADPTSTRTSTRTSSIVTRLNPNSKFYTDNEIVIELVQIVGNNELSVKQMMGISGLKHRQNFLEYHLEPALREKFIRRKYPSNPNHPRQKYLLTVKGLALYNELKNLEN